MVHLDRGQLWELICPNNLQGWNCPMMTVPDRFRNPVMTGDGKCYRGETGAAFTANCHCVMHRLAAIPAKYFFPLHATSISYNHWCPCGACYYRPRWVTMTRLVTPPNTPVIQLEINVYAASRHFSLISFLWWWREVLSSWHLNFSSRD